MSKVQVAAAQTSVSVNIVSFRQTRFFECEHLFINKPMVKTISRPRLLGMELNLYPSKQAAHAQQRSNAIHKESLSSTPKSRKQKKGATNRVPNAWAGLFKAGLRLSRV